MESDVVRAKFIRYFEGSGHAHLPSSPLVVQGDPSVLFTIAGMQQFNAYYQDPARAPSRRVVTVQRCMRTNDIEEVGDDTHHTMFEMLGNFAFGRLEDGGYFKTEAIAYAYEFVTRELGIAHDQLWITTWSGEPGIPADEEAVALWQARGILRFRIRPINRKPDGSRENFWGPTGDSGPCGPCSEIHIDRLGTCPVGAADADCGPEHECGRFVEVWNLVFNQYYLERDGSLRPLEHTGIDTGLGFERFAAFMAGVPSAYETDLFAPIIREIEDVCDVKYGDDPDVTRAVRIVADHVRSATFLVGDGVLPSNEARGYVVRRLLRRAVRYARALGRREAFVARIARAVIGRMAVFYPHLAQKQAVIEQVLEREEAQFSRTLAGGLELLNQELARLERHGERTLDGAAAFRLYDTFGFPFELTQEVAAAAGYEVDAEGFAEALRAQRERSRGSGRFREQAGPELPAVDVSFEGYDRLVVDGATVEYVRQGGEAVATADASDAEVWLVLDRTPFYAERGGQVGDVGRIVGPSGTMEVRTTQAPAGEVVVHIGQVVDGYIAQGEHVRAEVDEPARQATMRHHTATHLLHAALRTELGEHVHQAGSLVAPDRLRFDFSHGEALSSEQRRAVERRVNDAIRRDLPVQTDVMPLEQALQAGAIALFDERYGETARVLTIGDVSRELCGGTHVRQTGEIGSFVLSGESSVGSGMRRVEAQAGAAAEQYVAHQIDLLDEVARAVGAPRDGAAARVRQLLADLAEARRAAAAAARQASQGGLEGLLGAAETVETPGGTVKILATEVPAARAPTVERLREVSDWLRDKLVRPSVLVLASVPEGRPPQLLAAVSKDLTARGAHAGNLLKEVGRAMDARAGGRPEMAQGGGGDPARLAAALARGRELAHEQLGTAGGR